MVNLDFQLKYFQILNQFNFKKSLQQRMVNSAFIQFVDRLHVKSILRGSTASIFGIAGTLALFILCLAIYIPPAINILSGDFFETEIYHKVNPNQQFYSNEDFKIAVVFKNKIDNSVANHTAILDFAYSHGGEQYGDYSQTYQQSMEKCDPNYFADAINPVILTDCFIFPSHAKYYAFEYFGSQTFLVYVLFSKKDHNPFNGIYHSLNSYQTKLENLLQKYYYQVYFTSKIIDKAGNNKFQVNRYFSTSNEPTSQVATTYTELFYCIKNTTMDLSINPWINNQTRSNLVWLGQLENLLQLGPESSAKMGPSFAFTHSSSHMVAYRYYKKIDLLLGVIGGAMLLFYLILWVPFNYINKTLHQIRNASSLLLEHKGKQGEPILLEDLYPIDITYKYWLSHPVTNFFFPTLKKEASIIEYGEKELDIVSFVKKMKIIERTLKKKSLEQPYEPKMLKLNLMETQHGESINEVVSQLSQAVITNVEQNLVEIQQQQFHEEVVDYKFELPQPQIEYISDGSSGTLFNNNITAMALAKDHDQTNLLKDAESKDKWQATYKKGRQQKRFRRVFNFFCQIIQMFDFFGSKPTLIASPNSSSLLGLFVTLIIILLACLTVGLTVRNQNVPQLQILSQFKNESNFEYNLVTGKNLKIAVCFSYIFGLMGSTRYAQFRFFADSAQGRVYIPPVQLTQNDYDLFDIKREDSPINIKNCFTLQAGYNIKMGQKDNIASMFGFRIQPYCSGTADFCQKNSNASLYNFVLYMNNAAVWLFLPESRFNLGSRSCINNLLYQPLNINEQYMNNITSMEETVYVDEVLIYDDTKNYFYRKQPITTYRSISINPQTPYATTRNFIDPFLHYEVKIRPTSQQDIYLISTPKADTILAIIGGVIVFWYAICQWLAKGYNNFNVRAKLAEQIYEQKSSSTNVLVKLLAISPLPICLLPTCFDIKNTVKLMREIDKKIINNLDYLWLVKYVDNCFNLSSAYFDRIQEKHLSLVYVKEKINQAMQVVGQVDPTQTHNEDQFLMLQGQNEDKSRPRNNKRNQIKNQNDESAMRPQQSYQNEKMDTKRPKQQRFADLGQEQMFAENYMSGHKKPIKFAWVDMFQYQSSLTFRGKREVTSCFGGCCCLILLLFIILVSVFEVKVYLDRSDTKVGMTTSIMQPLSSQSTSEFSSEMNFITGTNFKLAVTFSSLKNDFPHDISTYIQNGLEISVFQNVYTKSQGKINLASTQYPLVACSDNYLTAWLSTLVDQAYYSNGHLGYCIPDGISLKIAGMPEDPATYSFTLSIFDRLGTTAGQQNLVSFLHNYYPKFYYTTPNRDYLNKKIQYEMTSANLYPGNITRPIQLNISMSKVMFTYDDQIGLQGDPYSQTTYNIILLNSLQTEYVGALTDKMFFNLTFSNSYYIESYLIVGTKFYQTFGIIGGLVAFFIFGFGILPRSFNNYFMKYKIGNELYILDMLKKKQAQQNKRSRTKKKTTNQGNFLSDINHYSEGEVFLAYLASFIGGLKSNYNLYDTLRRVTLIQQKVEKDISLYEVYKKLHNYRDTLNKSFRGSHIIKPADIFCKHIYNPEPMQSHLQGYPKIQSYAKKNNWSGFEQYAVLQAISGRVNISKIFDNKYLEQAFNIELGSQNNSVYMANMDGTVNSGTGAFSEMSREVDTIPMEFQQES